MFNHPGFVPPRQTFGNAMNRAWQQWGGMRNRHNNMVGGMLNMAPKMVRDPVTGGVKLEHTGNPFGQQMFGWGTQSWMSPYNQSGMNQQAPSQNSLFAGNNVMGRDHQISNAGAEPWRTQRPRLNQANNNSMYGGEFP